MKDTTPTKGELVQRVEVLVAERGDFQNALRGLIRWRLPDGPCWCECKREAASLRGDKIHSGGCRAAKAIFEEVV